MNKKEMEKDFQKDLLDMFEATIEMAVEDELLKPFIPLVESEIKQARKMIRCLEEEGPLITGVFASYPEILTAMEVDWNSILAAPFEGFLPMFDDEAFDTIKNYLDRSSVSSTVCGFHKLLENRIAYSPTPSAMISLTRPCDGLAVLFSGIHQYWAKEGWRNVSNFNLVTPYKDDELGLKYGADSIRQFIEFLENQTGKKLDITKLKGVVEKTNEQYQLWSDLNDVARSKPCPYHGFSGMFAWHTLGNAPQLFATDETTEFLKSYIQLGLDKYKNEREELEGNEKIRILWVDLPPFQTIEIVTLLADEFKAKVVMDSSGLMRKSSIVDTSTEQSMFEGLVTRHMFNGLMLKLGSGSFDKLITEIEWAIKAYDVDCVFGFGHIGHKDCNSVKGLVTEACNKLNVPILNFNYDVYDDRFASKGDLRNIFSNFFDAYGLGR